MNYDRQIQTSFFVMLAVQTIGSIDMPGKGKRKLPSPRAYVAAVVVWAVLGIVPSKAAAVVGWVTVLTAIVVGPFSQGVLHFFDTIATKFIAQGPPEMGGPDTGNRQRHKRASDSDTGTGGGPIIA